MNSDNPKVVFIHPRWVYDSYTDYRRLVELGGFEVRDPEGINFQEEAIFVVSPMNGEIRPRIEHLRKTNETEKKCVLATWLLERPDGDNFPFSDLGDATRSEVGELLKWFDAVWASDKLLETVDPRIVHVVMGSDKGLREGDPLPKTYDFCHFMAPFPRRSPMFDEVCQTGSYNIGPTGWGEARANVLKASRAMLNIHKSPAPIGEPLRFVLAAAYSVPLITETIAEPWPLEPGKHLIMNSHYEIVRCFKEILADPNLQKYGDQLYDLLCVKYPFRECVEQGAKETLRRLGK